MTHSSTQKQLHFVKMHGLGNDFVVIDAINQSFDITKFNIPHLANRHTGIGFDQLLIIEPSKNADFFCRIFNADGSEAEQCGNGLRCVARFIQEEKLHTDSSLTIETKAGIFPVHVKDFDHITVTLGAPIIEKQLVEIKLSQHPYTVNASILSLGNPHTIIKVEAIEPIIANQLGPDISSSPLFPNGTNVGFMEVINQHHIRLRTYERGAGETLACGSNACAAICAGIINNWLQHKVEVQFRNGSLFIEWNGKEENPIFMTGPTARVYEGEI